jgi:hypothetical protein
MSNGQVLARFAWTPSGWGQQYLDVSLSATFNGWAHSAPLSEFQSTVDWFNLASNTTYYSRIATWTGSAWVHSDAISFRTLACTGGFTVASDLSSRELSPTAVSLDWDRGNDNHWFCVDTAHSLNDLYNLQGSWRNHNCGTTSSSADVYGLDCDSNYYWRVWSVGSFTTGHSDHASFSLDACTFTVPDDLRDEVLSSTSVKFSWDAGLDNDEFCVDTARSLNDLFGFSGTWDNHGCWATEPTITATGLRCNTQYFWRVYARGDTGDGHSDYETVTTSNCG